MVPTFAFRGVDPDAAIVGDRSPPLVFYQLAAAPSPCGGLRLVQDASGGLRIDCP